MQSFVALDFETANGKRASACWIRLAKFDAEGRVEDTYHSLIRPIQTLITFISQTSGFMEFSLKTLLMRGSGVTFTQTSNHSLAICH